MAISTNGVMLTRLTGALYNQQLSASTYSEILAGNTTAAALNAWANAAVAADFGTKTDLQVATTLITNVGLSSVAGLANWVAAQLTAAGTAKRGETIISLLNSYSNMDTTEAIYGASVATFNTKVDASQAASQTSGNTGGTYAAVSALTPASAITLLSSVDLKTTGAGDDTFTASGSTLTAGDVLNGGAGTDTLSISTTAAATLGAGVTSSLIENISATATVGTLTLDAASMTGVAKVTNAGSTSDVVVSSLPAIVDVAITAASGATTVGFATAITSGAADSVNLALNGATGGVTLAGFETLNVTTAGSASGTATAPVVITDTSLQKLTVTGTTANFLSASFDGATGSTVATVTGSAGADSLVLTAGASAKVSGDMGAGNDNLRVSTIVAGYTVAGGDGTDTITYGGTATVAATATANLSTFETVTLTAAPASFSLVASTVNYTTVAPTASTYVGLASGGTLALPLGGTTTLTNTLWTTPTTDTMNVTVGASTTAGALTAAITTTGMETVTIANSSLGTDTTSQRTVGVTDALLKSLTVTGNQPTALTGGGAALTTVNASGVTGNVTMAGLALSTTTASTITGGDGNDTLTAATASLADSIVGGAGNDTITGAQGADTLTGGTGNDTFTIALNSATVGVAQQSGATLTDTITDFTSGADKLNLTQATSFLGNYANLTAGLAATAGSGVGANQAFYSLADNIVYVIATAGTLASTDTMVKLSNAPATLAAGDLNFGTGGNTITLTVAGSTVAAGTLTTNTSTYNDIINSTAAFLVGSSIDGGVGSGDTLNITDAAPAIIFALNAAGNSINNIEIINLNLGSTGTVTIPTLTTGSLVVNNAHASNASTVVLGAQTAQIAPLTTGTQSFVSVSTGIDTVSAGAAGQSISTGGGDDVVNVGSQAIFFGGTYNGGAGTNDVLNVTLAATQPISFAATAVAGGAAVATGFEVINVAQNNAASTVTIVPDAAVTVNFTAAAAAEITVTGTGGAVTANAGAIQQLTVNGTGNVTVGGTNTTGAIIFSATKTAGTNSVTDSANSHTITNNSAIVVTVDATLQTATDTLAGAGPFTINNLITTGAIAGGNATGVITVNGTTAAVHSSIVTGSAADVVTITGTAANAQTITTNAGNDTVTLSLTGAANVVNLGAGNDTYLAGAAGGSVTGGTGSDSMTGGAGADLFLYGTGDSGGVTTDTITGFNFNADFIRTSITMTSASFLASTATTTASGYNNYNSATGAITIQTDDGTMSINTASSTNAPGVSGSLQTTSALQYVITGSTAANTITTGAGNDTITGGAAADIITISTGSDVIIFTGVDAATTAVETGGGAANSLVLFIAGTSGDQIINFTTGTDKLNFPALATVNAIGTEIDTLLSITSGGTITNAARFVDITTQVADFASATVLALLTGLITTAVAVGDSFIAAVHSSAHTQLYLVVQTNIANIVTAGDVTLIGQLTGVTTSLTNGDFVSY